MPRLEPKPALLFLFSFLLVAAYLTIDLTVTRRAAYEQARALALTQVQLTAQRLDGMLKETAQLITFSAREIDRQPDQTAETLRTWLLFADQVVNAAVYDGEGIRRAFLRRREPIPAEHISPVELERYLASGQLTVTDRGVRIQEPLQQGGVAVACIESDFLQRDLQMILGSTMSALVTDPDRSVVAGWGDHQAPGYAELMDQGASFNVLHSSVRDSHVIAISQIAGWSLRVVLVMPPDQILRAWRSRARNAAIFFLFGFTAVALAMRMVLRRSRQVWEMRNRAVAADELARERENLVRETHHRVKNNLAVIQSILSLEAHRADTEEVRSLISNLKGRIASISLIHSTLYQTENLTHLPFDRYCIKLLEHVQDAYDIGEVRAQITMDAEPMLLPVDTVKRLGLILHELVGNAFKHARADAVTPAQVSVHARMVNTTGETMELLVEDSGPGLPPDALSGSHGSIGYLLVNALVSELRGELHHWNDGGAHIRITFPVAPSVPAHNHAT